MKLRPMLAGAALLTSLAVPTLASAAPGFATGNVNMRAGPGTDYPVITTVYSGAPVEIVGCLSGWSWCDVAWSGARGWVSGNYLQTIYQEERVYLPNYAPQVGLPVVSFSFGYWDDHYRSRSFYRDRDRWSGGWRGERREDRQEVRQERRELQQERNQFQRQRERLRDRIDNANTPRQAERRRDRLQEERREFRQERREFRQERRDILCPGPRCQR